MILLVHNVFFKEASQTSQQLTVTIDQNPKKKKGFELFRILILMFLTWYVLVMTPFQSV